LKILIPWYRYPPFSGTSVGGLSVSIWDLSRSLQLADVPVEVLCPPEDSSEEVVRLDDMTILRNRLGGKLLENRKLDRKEIEFLKSYDWVISVNNFGANSLSEIKGNVVRLIHTIAHDRSISSYLSLNAGPAEYFRILYQRSKERSAEATLSGTTTICVSKYNSAKMIEHKLEVESKIHYIPNGIDTSIFRPAKKDKKFDLIFIGRFQKHKGLDILLNAISILEKRGRRPNVAIVGNFSDYQRQFCANHLPSGSRNSLHFIGTVPHERIPDLINSSRVLVVPSRYESFSLPTLEALACGVPVIATSVGGIPELLDGNTGILLESLEGSELARSIENALTSTSLQENALKFGPAKAKDYDSAVLAKDVKKLLLRW
jgi:glycosyltransferase involved in cell wall biosynthesis